MSRFEAVGDVANWPKNEHSKPTQAAVFGVINDAGRKRFEILWTGRFPDLEPALYWAAKKEAQAIRKGKWQMASRVVWQHDLTPEQAVAAIRKEMEPQIDPLMRAYRSGGEVDIGPGPMGPVTASEAALAPQYVEIAHESDPENPMASFVLPPSSIP